MDNPDWAKVLQILYEGAPEMYDIAITEDHIFVQETGLKKDTVENAVEKLEEWSLIKKEQRSILRDPEEESVLIPDFGYQLSEEGFKVAYDREISRRDAHINQALVIFTFVLAVAELIGIYPNNNVKAVGSFLLLLSLCYGILRTDLIDF